MRGKTKDRQPCLWLGIALVALVVGIAPPPLPAEAPAGQAASTGPRQILIIRHGEKPGNAADEDQDPAGPVAKGAADLSTRGYERAGALAPYFPATFAKPDFLFATKASSSSNRPVETITPLAQALNLTINSQYANTKEDIAKLVAELQSNPMYNGKTVLICWHHGKIPKLAHDLGVSKDKITDPWPDAVFDWVWQIDNSGGKARLTILPQKLLYGDSSTAP